MQVQQPCNTTVFKLKVKGVSHGDDNNFNHGSFKVDLLCSRVVYVANVSFEQTNLSNERTERNHFMNWFVPYAVQLSSAASMPAGSGTAVAHSWIFGERRSQHAGGEGLLLTPERTWLVIRSWFANLLHTENCRWGRNSRSRTVLKVALCHSLTHGRGVDSLSVTVLLKLALCC